MFKFMVNFIFYLLRGSVSLPMASNQLKPCFRLVEEGLATPSYKMFPEAKYKAKGRG